MEGRKSSRPFSVTLLSDLVLILSVYQLARGGWAFAQFDYLQSLLPFSPVYLVISGLFWGLTGLILFWWFWQGMRAGRWLLIGYSGLFSLYYWLDRALMPGYPGRNMNWLYVAVVNIFMLGWVIWVCTRPKVRNFFEGADEQRPEESTAT